MPRVVSVPKVCVDTRTNESHIGSFEIPLSAEDKDVSVSALLPTVGIQFRWTPANLNSTWHNAPVRQLSISNDAKLGVQVSGTPYNRTWQVGEVHLEEDLSGTGHRSINLGQARHSVFIPVADSFNDGSECTGSADSLPESGAETAMVEGLRDGDGDMPSNTTVYKICTDPGTNETHVLPMYIPLSPKSGGGLSQMINVSGVQWVWTSATSVHPWHNPRQRQFVINLDAGHKVQVSGAPYQRVFAAGEVLFVEDVYGKGHVTMNLGKARTSLVVPVDHGFDSGPCHAP